MKSIQADAGLSCAAGSMLQHGCVAARIENKCTRSDFRVNARRTPAGTSMRWNAVSSKFEPYTGAQADTTSYECYDLCSFSGQHAFPCFDVSLAAGSVCFAPDGAEALIVQEGEMRPRRIPLGEAPGCGQQ